MCPTGFHQSEDVDTLVHPVMTKVECNKEGTNVRHVVTCSYMKSPKEIYERFYYEKVILTAVRIKEFKTKIKVEFVRDHPIRAMMRMALRKAS